MWLGAPRKWGCILQPVYQWRFGEVRVERSHCEEALGSGEPVGEKGAEDG